MAAGVVPNPDPRQITTPLVLVGLGLGVGEGLGLGVGLGLVNQIAISTRGGNNLAGVENGHNTGIVTPPPHTIPVPCTERK